MKPTVEVNISVQDIENFILEQSKRPGKFKFYLWGVPEVVIDEVEEMDRQMRKLCKSLLYSKI